MRDNKVAVERQKEIYSLIKQSGTVRVTNLSKRFKVTTETIRRDLEQMERDGLLHRMHGGAYLEQPGKDDNTLVLRNKENKSAESFLSIAAEAAKLVEHGDIIGLDSSVISYQLAKRLINQDITVITNSILVTSEFLNSKSSKVKVITVGGYLNKDSSSFVGNMSEKLLETYNVDKFFFSCSGFHIDHGVFENDELEAQVKYKFTTISDKSFLMADHTRFGEKSLTSFMKLNKLELVILDQNIALHNLASLKNNGINVHVAK